MTKESIRRDMLLKRKSLDHTELEVLTNELLERIESHPRFTKATRIGLYYPINQEPNLLILMTRHKDKRFYFPRVVDNQISYFLVNDLNDLEKTVFQLFEPKLTLTESNDLDLYLIPCVATTGCYRIGYGRGYFDQYLKRNKGYTIGVTMPFAKFQQGYEESHDIALDEIL